MSTGSAPEHAIKEPKGLSKRIQWLRDYYFQGTERAWNNEYTSWTTGTPWDIIYNEMTFYIVPETYTLLTTLGASYLQAARPVALPEDFWQWPRVQRRAWFVREVIVNYVPQEMLPGDLLAGARFNIQTSLCFTKEESSEWLRMIRGKDGARSKMKWFHDHGYGNAGATSGHLIPGHERLLKIGWKGVYAELLSFYNALSAQDRKGAKGAQLKAMMTASTMARDLALKYKDLCLELAAKENDPTRKNELTGMAQNLSKVPWEPATTFWEAVQALWLNHMLVMTDENYPGPGVSFSTSGRIISVPRSKA